MMFPFRATARRLTAWLAAILIGACGLAPLRSKPASAATRLPPRLVVLIVFDQMRADYQERWKDLFTEGGFRRLQSEGAWFQNCNYPFAYTFTGPGHASLATGYSPRTHGIINNEWYDRASHAIVGCVENPRFGASGKPSGKTASPERLMSPAFADRIKEATGGRAQVVSLSIKDRSAVLLGGHRADVCCWLDGDTGTFTTSGYYRGGLPGWVADFNRVRPADAWLGRSWERLLPQLDYTQRSGPDDVVGEGFAKGQGRTFPHALGAGSMKPGKAYYQALYASPFENELLLQLASRGIDAGKLGQHADPDVLCISFSCTDSVGHVWGPDSQEVLDVTLRADRIMRDLLAHLDARVGRGAYLMVVSADHGVCPLPEVSRAAGRDAGRIDPKLLASRADAFLGEKFGKPAGPAQWIEGGGEALPWFYLNQRLIRERGLQSTAVENALADWLKRQPGIQTAYTRTQLTAGIPDTDPLGRQVQLSFYRDRSGDVGVVVKPYYIIWSAFPGTGTTHGSPHPYDTHVPFFVFGSKVVAGVRRDAVIPQAAAPIMLDALDIPAPRDTEAAAPGGLWQGEGKR
jgi:hypothetical protein